MSNTLSNYKQHLNKKSLEEIQDYLGDDVRWITPQYIKSTYLHPEDKPLRPWKVLNPTGGLSGPLSNVNSTDEIEAFEWPQTKYLDFTETLNKLNLTGDFYRLSGFWSPFFHDLTYLIGTEELLIKMYTQPDIVHALLNRLCSFYLEANEIFFAQAGELMDAVFIGNDFGSQTDLLMSPELFEEFYLDWIKKFADQAHHYGYHCVMHSCGSIYRIIDKLISVGIDCIHPLQSIATNMDAEYLAGHFKGKIIFMGGIDTQHLLPFGSPDEVRRETIRLINILGPGLIVSPSHEALMPNVPVENIVALAEAVKEMRYSF